MTHNAIIQLAFYFIILLILIFPLGTYMARVYQDEPCGLDKIIRPLEYSLYKLCSIRPNKGMNWKKYLASMLMFNLMGFLVLYAIQRLQFYLPLNPQSFSAPSPALAFNTAISFVTNTNWQAYAGENTLSYFTQTIGLTIPNFISAASGMCLLIALCRGLSNQENSNLGNFWKDLIRSILYILLPLSILLSVVLVSQGVIQNFKPYQKITLVQPYQTALQQQQNPTEPQLNQTELQQNQTTLQQNPMGFPQNQAIFQQQSQIVSEQILPMGPVASLVAIKQIGTNGGGYFNTNSAHPFENPTPVSNFFEMLAIMLIPAALCYTFGKMVQDNRQGLTLLIAIFILFIPMLILAVVSEQQGNLAFNSLGIDQSEKSQLMPGGNMEGKETRFGIVNSALWATATTATANGSVNAMHDSFTPLGGYVTLWMMHLGETIFGGAGSGLYGMLMMVIIAVFTAGLMVGRTPEYLGKKIEPYEMRMASLSILIMPLIVLICTAIASVLPEGTNSLGNPGPHGFSEILYTFTSQVNNNGSAFAGLNADTPFYNILGGLAMLVGRYWVAIPVLAIAGSLARKKIIPSSVGTLTTHTPLFIVLLACIILVVGALSFIPALILGPIIEQIQLWEHYGR